MVRDINTDTCCFIYNFLVDSKGMIDCVTKTLVNSVEKKKVEGSNIIKDMCETSMIKIKHTQT